MKTRFAGFQPIRPDRLIWGQEYRHDAYKSKNPSINWRNHGLPAMRRSVSLGAMAMGSQASLGPRGVASSLSPATMMNPGWFLTVGGSFLKEHREKLLLLVKNVEARAKAEHPLERIIKIEEQDDSILITTTGIHLARGIGEAPHHAYKGEREFHYNEQENLLRVVWER